MSKTALITGASSGMGREFAFLLAKEGYDLVVVARRLDRLNDLASEIAKIYPVSVFVIGKDLATQNAAEELFLEMEDKGISIDILINNAGFTVSGKFYENDLTRHMSLIHTNIEALTKLTYLAVASMKAKGQGKILQLGSVVSFAPAPQNATYSGSKGYVLLFSESLSADLKGTGVSITVLCPGATRTEFAEKSGSDMAHALSFRLTSMTAKKVAEIGYKALIKGRRVVVAGWVNKLYVFFLRILPRSLNLFLSSKLY